MMNRLFTLASTFLIIASILAGVVITSASASSSCSTPCDEATCMNVQCSFSAPFSCTANGSVSCYSNASQVFPTACDSCCDASVCATPSCSASCPTSVCALGICTGTATPFVCTAGESVNGCAPAASVLINNTLCSACCDTSSCGSSPTPAPISPPPPPSPTNATPQFNCDHSCRSLCDSPRRCGSTIPFMCTTGASMWGCSSNASLWPSSSNFCGSCCDVRKCSVTCTKCPADQCFAPVCASSAPYTCTAGVEAGGCSSTPEYWSQNPGCTSCCYC